MVQIVAEAEGTVVLKSRTIVSVLDLFGINSYIPSLIGIFDAYGENAQMFVTPARPWVLSFNSSVTKVLGLCAPTATKSQYCSHHITGSVGTILTGDIPLCVLLLPVVFRAPV